MRHHILHLRMIFLVRQPAPLCLLDHGVCHGMGIVFLQAGGKPQHFGFILPAKGDDLCNLWRGAGQRAGLIEYDGVRLGNGLQKAPALDGNRMPAAFPHGKQHRNGDSQLERAGKIHHKDRQCFGHIAGQQVGGGCAAQRIGYQLVRHTGCLVLGGGFQLFRFLNHPHDTVIASAADCLFHADDTFALLHHSSGKNGAAGALGHRQGFAGQRGLVHKRFALGYVPVQRNHTAGAYHNAVAGTDVIYLGQHLGAVYLLPHAVYLQAHGTGEVRHRFLVCPVL